METKKTTAVAAQQTATELQKKQKNISDNVLERVSTMEQAGSLALPKGYHAGNALRLAWLTLQNVEDKNHHKALEVCSKDSIANSLLEMVVKGLNPVNKQCYFIVMGTELTLFEDYRGKYMRAKRDTEIASITPQVIYENDKFVQCIDDLGQYQLVSHETSLQNMNIQKIIGAYAIVVRKDGTRYMEVMTMDMIRNSWKQGAAKGNSGAHINFTDQMCKKTIMSRACKIALGAAADELGEQDPAMAAREAAQTAAPASPTPLAEYEEISSETTEVVDVSTGEVVTHEAAAPAPAVAEQPADNDCPI